MLTQLISTAGTTAAADRHRALIMLRTPTDGTLRTFAATRNIPFISARHASDRADRITEVLGCEFDILIHETRDEVDVGLLAALAGTVKAGGVLVLGLPFSIGRHATPSGISPFNQRFARLLCDLQLKYPGKVLWSSCCLDSTSIAEASTGQPGSMPGGALAAPGRSPAAWGTRSLAAATHEQDTLLQRACNYLQHHSQGCITITGRRGRGKSALLGRIASWLQQQDISFAVTAARQSTLASVRRHSSGHGVFMSAADAHLSGCRVLLVDEASSLPISLLRRFLATHEHVIYCTTVEGYENAGRAFAIRFGQVLRLHHAHALALMPETPWRWHAGDPLEYLIDTLLMGGAHAAGNPSLPVTGNHLETGQDSADTDAGKVSSNWRIRLLDRAALALDEALLQQVYGLLRDTHYQTSAADLSHLLDAADLQLWVLEENGPVKAALLLATEGGIDACLHEAIVSKQRRLPHQLLPQLLAQSANQAQVLEALYGRVIRIAVADRDRRRGLGSRLLQGVECAVTVPLGPASGIGASFASDAVSIGFWEKNGYTRFHTGFKPNPRTGKPAIAVIKGHTPALQSVVRLAASIHEDNLLWLNNSPGKSDSQHRDADLLQRFARGQRSVHDTYAALSRLARQHHIPLHLASDTSRRQYEAALREAVKAALE